MKARENLSAWMAERARGISDAITGGAFLDAYTALIRQEEQAALRPLVEALNGMVDLYVRLVESGDAGFWDAEKVEEVIAARAALSALALPEE
jgi:hypothetical protein